MKETVVKAKGSDKMGYKGSFNGDVFVREIKATGKWVRRLWTQAQGAKGQDKSSINVNGK